MVAGGGDGSTFCVAEHDDDLGARDLTGVFHRSQHILVHDVPRDAHAENITDPLVENEFRWHPGIDAGKDGGEWELPVAGGEDLFLEVSLDFKVLDKALVSFAEDSVGVLAGEVFLNFFGLCSHDNILVRFLG